MALRLHELHPGRKHVYLCTPTGNELPEMVAHWRALSELLESDLTFVSDGKTLYGECLRQHCLPSWRMRWCTRELKIRPFQTYLIMNAPAISYVGLRADEIDSRQGVDHAEFLGIENRYPLADWGWGINEVVDYLACRGVSVPKRTDCAACPLQTLYEWWRLWRVYPEEYRKAELLESTIGHTFRSDGRDTWPAALKDLRHEFESGRKPKEAIRDSKRMCSWCAR